MSSFAELGVSPLVWRVLKRRGIAAPFQIQRLVIPDFLAGRDVLAKSRTGSGKTLAFAIPAVERLSPTMARPSALVLVPTRELAVQVTEEMRDIAASHNLRVASVYGGVGIEKQARQAAKAHMVVATPGRLTDLLNRKLISISKVKILVLDEADRMLDMGFQPQVDRIVKRLPNERQTMFFGATLDGVTGNMARAYTKDPVRHEVAEPRPAIEEAAHRFVAVDGHGKLNKLIEVLGEDRDLALVFVRTKRGADHLRSKLKAKGVGALAIHGDMRQEARRRALDRFASRQVDILIATDVAARGLDLDDISHVINYDLPNDHKGYVHRVGRTARAGRTGTGVTLVDSSQRADVSGIVRALQLNHEFEAQGHKLAAPVRIYSSHGARSMMHPRRKRR